MQGGAKVGLEAPVIDVVASGNLNEKAPWVDIQGGSKVRAWAPEIELGGGAKIGRTHPRSRSSRARCSTRAHKAPPARGRVAPLRWVEPSYGLPPMGS